MKKENLHIRAIRYFYDIVGELDEVSYATLTNFGNNIYMLFMTVALVGFLSFYIVNRKKIKLI